MPNKNDVFFSAANFKKYQTNVRALLISLKGNESLQANFSDLNDFTYLDKATTSLSKTVNSEYLQSH